MKNDFGEGGPVYKKTVTRGLLYFLGIAGVFLAAASLVFSILEETRLTSSLVGARENDAAQLAAVMLTPYVAEQNYARLTQNAQDILGLLGGTEIQIRNEKGMLVFDQRLPYGYDPNSLAKSNPRRGPTIEGDMMLGDAMIGHYRIMLSSAISPGAVFEGEAGPAIVHILLFLSVAACLGLLTLVGMKMKTSIVDFTLREIAAREMSQIDLISGMPNRVALYRRLENLFYAATGNSELSLLLVDIDDFKEINDHHGHGVGDTVLRDVARRISALVGHDFSFAAHPGGDEFLLVFEGSESKTQEAAAGLLQDLCGPYPMAGMELFVTVSIGISRFPRDGKTINEMMRAADLALIKVKESGKRDFQFFENELGIASWRKMLVEKNLRQAIDRGELAVHFQPQYDLSLGKISGFEALLRWRNPQLGEVSPSEFIEIAENSGQILTLGDWALREACRFCRVLLDSGHGSINVSVNFSALQVMRKDFVEGIQTTLNEFGVPMERVTIELTETVLIKSVHEVASRLKALKAIGSRISLDDFGTGYSSLSYLQKFPFDEVKIDKTFIEDLESNRRKVGIIRSLVGLSQQHELEVVVEGVETAGQMDILRDIGCDRVQGYRIAAAMSEKDAIQFLHDEEGKLSTV